MPSSIKSRRGCVKHGLHVILLAGSVITIITSRIHQIVYNSHLTEAEALIHYGTPYSVAAIGFLSYIATTLLLRKDHD